MILDLGSRDVMITKYVMIILITFNKVITCRSYATILYYYMII